MTPNEAHIIHEIEPVFDAKSRVLMLGTMPSPKSREQGFYYGHPQNRFWKVLAAVFDAEVPQTIPEKKQLLLTHHIALWDVLASCTIAGASDASIRDPKPNNIAQLCAAAPIEQIFCTGAKASPALSQALRTCSALALRTAPFDKPRECSDETTRSCRGLPGCSAPLPRLSCMVLSLSSPRLRLCLTNSS